MIAIFFNVIVLMCLYENFVAPKACAKMVIFGENLLVSLPNQFHIAFLL